MELTLKQKIGILFIIILIMSLISFTIYLSYKEQDRDIRFKNERATVDYKTDSLVIVNQYKILEATYKLNKDLYIKNSSRYSILIQMNDSIKQLRIKELTLRYKHKLELE